MPPNWLNLGSVREASSRSYWRVTHPARFSARSASGACWPLKSVFPSRRTQTCFQLTKLRDFQGRRLLSALVSLCLRVQASPALFLPGRVHTWSPVTELWAGHPVVRSALRRFKTLKHFARMKVSSFSPLAQGKNRAASERLPRVRWSFDASKRSQLRRSDLGLNYSQTNCTSTRGKFPKM